MREQYHNLLPVTALLPAARSATATSAAIDLQGANSAMIVVHAGAWTDGTHTFSLTECATSGGSYTAVAAGDIVGTAPVVSSAPTASLVTSFAYVGSKEFIKVVQTVSGATTGAVTGAVVLKGNVRHGPAQ